MIDLSKIKERVTKAAQKWVSDTDVEEKVYHILNTNFENVVKATLGFRKDSWHGNWEFDNTNGRQERSVIGHEVWPKAEIAARQVIIDLLNQPVTWTEIERAKFQTFYKARVKKEIEARLERSAETYAKDVLAEIIQQEIAVDALEIEIRELVSQASEATKLSLLNTLKQ